MKTPSYYAIIPANVRYAQISPNSKLLYGEITALCHKEGYCFANNAYFASLYESQPRTIQRWLGELKKIGAIYIEAKDNGRKIFISEGVTKLSPPHDKIVTHNNTRFNNTVNKEKSTKKENVLPCWLDAELWCDFLEHRKALKKPMTERAMAIMFSSIEKLMNGGENPNAILEQSIQNGWAGVFTTKRGNKNGNSSRKPSQSEIIAEQIASIR